MNINWIIKKFDELTPHELYSILQLRNIVFAIEQNCVYPDMDDKDQPAEHLMAWQNEKLIAYTRILPPGIKYVEPSLGRVVTAPFVRGEGIGKQLMEKSLEQVYNKYDATPVKISAQLYMKKFYTEFGFLQTSGVYLEDGIDHIEMVKP